MKKTGLYLYYAIVILAMVSCHKKKLKEVVVEVPLPIKEEKIIGNPDDVKANEGVFSLAKLNYKYNELEPFISGKTLEIHYSKHYLSYTNSLNKLLNTTEYQNTSIEQVLRTLDLNNTELRNNAGGYYNHTLYWENIAPKSGGTPKDSLASAINADFESFEKFKVLFSEQASKQFGSGWTWLIVDKTGKLQICTTPNQDNPLMPNQPVSGTPILALDVWEHAYYLDYQNQRKKYIDAFFNIINWKKVNERYLKAIEN